MVGEHLFHLRLRGGEPVARVSQPLHALLEQLQRVIEVEILRLEPANDLLEPLELAGEGQRLGRARHYDSVPSRTARAATSPSVTRRRKASPAGNWATR